jgi:glucose/mannose transport system substrate-binding protein
MRNPCASLVGKLATSLLCWVVCCSPIVSHAANGKEVEVFSYWTSGGEAGALQALINVFEKQNPGMKVQNDAIAGGTGTVALPVLQARLVGGNPPDTWQSHPGWELFSRYVDPGYCLPLNDLYKSDDWTAVVPKSLLDQITRNGNIYEVLTGIHRGNVLWYNKKLLNKYGIKIGDKITLEEFLAAADKLKAAGVTVLAVGDSGIWASGDILEDTLLAKLGAQGWADLFSEKLSWDSPNVKEALKIYAKLLDYQNPDHSALSWDQAVNSVIEGRCAFNVMGDWAYGEFLKANLKDNEDFGWVTFPGTQGLFMVVGDGFTLAKDAPHQEEAIGWLKAIGSKEGQLAFNKIKGSIPVRTDLDPGQFGPYHQWSMHDFAQDTLVPSVFHGAAAPPAFLQSLSDATTAFVVNKNVDSFGKALVEAAKEIPSNQ